MLYKLKETPCYINLLQGQSVEMAMVDHLASQGYQAIYHDYFLFHESRRTRHPENEQILRKTIGEQRLSHLREITSLLYPSGVGAGVAPEQPDLFVYNNRGDHFFCEVKQRRTGDRLRPPQMLGISLIATFLDSRVELAVIVESHKDVDKLKKEYQWVWPCVQECGFLAVNLTKGVLPET